MMPFGSKQNEGREGILNHRQKDNTTQLYQAQLLPTQQTTNPSQKAYFRTQQLHRRRGSHSLEDNYWTCSLFSVSVLFRLFHNIY